MNLNKDVSYSSESSSKNVARGAYIETPIESGFFVLTFQNDFDAPKLLEKDIDNSYLQFHFCLKGTTQFSFNQDSYSLDIPEGNSLLLYNPNRDLPIKLISGPKTWVVTVLISIKKFHGLFSHEANYISFLEGDNKLKKYYKDGYITPSMAIVLNQIINII